MSKIGSMNIVGAAFKPTITNATYNELKTIMDNATPINLSSAIIFSIPQENDEDIQGAGSIWLTDADGYLYCISEPSK